MRDDEIAKRLKEEVRAKLLALGEVEGDGDFALSARWPEPVLQLSRPDREARVRRGAETVILKDDDGTTRGFVRASLRVPLGHPDGQVYGVFVEVDRDAYAALQSGFNDHAPVRVWGTLATRLPMLEDAYGAKVCVEEDGSELRARIVDSDAPVILKGPVVG